MTPDPLDALDAPGQPRIAIVGNVAGNAYLLAKFLRRLGVAADSFDMGGGNPMWVPWWEECDLDPVQIGHGWYDWLAVARVHDFPRPPWAKIIGFDKFGAAWYDTQEAYQADLPAVLPGVVGPQVADTPEGRAALLDALAGSRLTEAEQRAAGPALAGMSAWRSVRELAQGYALVVLCGPYANYACVLPRSQPFVTFEHSTMRLVPSLSKPEYQALAAAYRHADANVITNADVHEAAWMLGLDRERYTFIPHPVDTDRFSPADDGDRDGVDEAARVRAQIEAGVPGGADLVLFAPARQSNSAETGAKRNDRVFYAFRRYIDEAEPRGLPRAALVAGMWGNPPDVAQSMALVRQLGLGERVVWLRAQPKRRMVALYRAADVVIDQFSEAVGSFGTCTAEALACGKPLITHIDPDAHGWCKPELPRLPPHCQARTAPEILDWLVDLAGSPKLRAERGAEGRAWVERYHAWDRVAERHLALYARVLGTTRAALVAPVPPPVPAAPPAEIVETDCGPVGIGHAPAPDAAPVAAG